MSNTPMGEQPSGRVRRRCSSPTQRPFRLQAFTKNSPGSSSAAARAAPRRGVQPRRIRYASGGDPRSDTASGSAHGRRTKWSAPRWHGRCRGAAHSAVREHSATLICARPSRNPVHVHRARADPHRSNPSHATSFFAPREADSRDGRGRLRGRARAHPKIVAGAGSRAAIRASHRTHRPPR